MEDNADADGGLSGADEDALPAPLSQTGWSQEELEDALAAEETDAQVAALQARLDALLLDGCTRSAEAIQGVSEAGNGDAAARCGVYVLALENGKYYVGSEANMERRIEKHKAKLCVRMLLAPGVAAEPR